MASTPIPFLNSPTETRVPFLQQGYKLVFKKTCISTAPNSGYQQVLNRQLYLKIGYGSDKRMRPPAGVVPTSKIRYTTYVETSASDTGSGEAAGLSALALTATRGYFPIPISAVTFQKSSIVFCNTFFYTMRKNII